MARTPDGSVSVRPWPGAGRAWAALWPMGLPPLAAATAAAWGGASWPGVVAVAAILLGSLWALRRGPPRPAAPVAPFAEFCRVVSGQLGLAVATSEAGARQTVQATVAIQALCDPAGPAPGPALTRAVQDIWEAVQHDDLLRQNLQAVQACLLGLAQVPPQRLFDAEARVFETALADLRAAYVMEAQTAADDPGRAKPAATPEIELF